MSAAAALAPRAWTSSDFEVETKATSTQMGDLESLYAFLADYSPSMNLVGPSALAEFWLRHAYDSAQLLHVEQSAIRWADVGAGAGFPGLVLAILLKRRAGAQVHLIESMGKRVRFLDHVAGALDLPVQVHHSRAERLHSLQGVQVVTARACAPFPRLFGYVAGLLAGDALGLFFKGRAVEEELTAARRSWAFTSELVESRSDPAGRLVRIRGLRPRG